MLEWLRQFVKRWNIIVDMGIGIAKEMLNLTDSRRSWGPSGYPDYPLRDESGKVDVEGVFAFMKVIRKDMKEWVDNGEYDLVKKVFVVKMSGNEKVSGMLIGIGVEKSNTPGFPHTPIVWMLPIEKGVSIDRWGTGMTELQRAEHMKILLEQRLLGDHDTDRRGGPGNLVVSVHGWGGSPLYPTEHTAEIEEAMVKCGAQPQKTVMLSLGSQGAWGTVEGDPREKDIEMVPDQIQGTLDQVARSLIRNSMKGQDVNLMDKFALEKTFWNRLKLVVGHSMGAWAVLRWRLKHRLDISSSRGNDALHILLMSMVTIGPEASDEQEVLAREHLNISRKDKNVTLLTAPVRGALVGNVDKILVNGFMTDVADSSHAIEILVASYMGGGRYMEKAFHQESILNDLIMIVANNFMLRHAGSLIQSKEELLYVRELVKHGLIDFLMGQKDRILFPVPIAKAISLLGGRSNADISHHYARAGEGVFDLMVPKIM